MAWSIAQASATDRTLVYQRIDANHELLGDPIRLEDQPAMKSFGSDEMAVIGSTDSDAFLLAWLGQDDYGLDLSHFI